MRPEWIKTWQVIGSVLIFCSDYYFRNFLPGLRLEANILSCDNNLKRGQLYSGCLSVLQSVQLATRDIGREWALQASWLAFCHCFFIEFEFQRPVPWTWGVVRVFTWVWRFQRRDGLVPCVGSLCGPNRDVLFPFFRQCRMSPSKVGSLTPRGSGEVGSLGL